MERKAAAAAAHSALQIEKRPRQGIQLAEQQLEALKLQHEKQDAPKDATITASQHHNFDSDHGMEIEVGQAAGIAFARALQSVPALSRETLKGG